jgi:hypothetical protein
MNEFPLIENPWFRLFQQKLLQCWWVVAVILLCGMVYELSLKNIHEEYSKLETVERELSQKKVMALAQQEELLLHLNSQSDPAWMELTLMNGLGLTPEGYKKYFLYPPQ